MLQDVRYAIRTLAKNPGFTTVAVTALALGIGANATVFSLVNAILFKSLPFADSERVLFLTSQNLRNPSGNDGVSYADYKDFASQVKSFESLGAHHQRFKANLSDDKTVPQNYQGARITANGFAAIGQRPILGRAFLPEDEKPGADPVAVLTFAMWQKRYGGDAGVVGRTIRIDSKPVTVIGVMGKGFALPPEAEFWQAFVPDGKEQRQNRFLSVFGKLASGVTREGAQAEISTIAKRLEAQYPDTNKDIGVRVQSYAEANIRGPVKTVFLILLGAVGFVLLIACANVANLMLARAVGRTREVSIRTALGAGRWRVIRQLLVESLLLSAAGGGIGWLIATWGVRAFDNAVIPTGKPVWIDFSLDYRACAHLAAISIATGILFGLAPALRLSRMDVNTALKDGGRGAGSGIRGKYLSGVLVVVEMTLAVVLLTGAGLMMRSFLNAYTRPTGVNSTNILTMRMDLPRAKYGKLAQQLAFQQTLAERLRALPGVESAAVASTVPSAGNTSMDYELEGSPAEAKRRPSSQVILTGDGYFQTLQVAARQGRVLSAADHKGGPPVAVINQTFAAKAWPNQNPIGKRLRVFIGEVPADWMTVAGVIPDILQNPQTAVKDGGRNPDSVAIMYFPFRLREYTDLAVMARTRVPSATLAQAFRREVQAIDPDLPVHDVITLEDGLALQYWPLRVFGAMFAIFAGIALLLATVGLYAVVAYGVSQRTQEIGLRVALGASAGSILRLVFSTGMWQMAIGLVLGLGAAFGVTRVLTTLLVGVSPTDALTYGVVAIVLTAAATLGCAIPARRAMRVDPAIALRHE